MYGPCSMERAGAVCLNTKHIWEKNIIKVTRKEVAKH